MNFLLVEQQVQLQDMLARLLTDKLPTTQLHAVFDGGTGMDGALWTAMLGLGLGGLCVPESQDGSGLEMLDAAVAAETLGYHAAPVPYLGHTLAAMALTAAGHADDLPKLASGAVLGTVALAEADGRWLPADWQVICADSATGGCTITGRKRFVPAGEAAALLVVGVAGGELVLVEPGASGMTRMPQEGIDRTRGMAEIWFDQTPALRLPGGLAAAWRLIDGAAVLLAADAFGGARRALDMAVDYAMQREQFGSIIGSFQAIKHQLANMALEVEPCRALYWFAAHAYDHRPAEASAAASLAKAHITERFLQATRDSVEIHGGIGFTWEYDIHIWLKRAMFDWAWAGAPRLHRARYAELMGW